MARNFVRYSGRPMKGISSMMIKLGDNDDDDERCCDGDGAVAVAVGTGALLTAESCRPQYFLERTRKSRKLSNFDWYGTRMSDEEKVSVAATTHRTTHIVSSTPVIRVKLHFSFSHP